MIRWSGAPCDLTRTISFFLLVTDSAYVQIIVTDENDNPPIFEYKLYEESVLESRATGTSILVVRATDQDEGKQICSRARLDLDEDDRLSNIFTKANLMQRKLTQKKESYRKERATEKKTEKRKAAIAVEKIV